MTHAWVYFRFKRTLRRSASLYRIYFHDAPPNWVWNLQFYWLCVKNPRFGIRYYRVRKLIEVGKTVVDV